MEIISAREAFDRGLTRYFTGVACKHGHVAERMVANGVCAECLRLRIRAWRLNNPEALAAQRARYREKHPETGRAAGKRYRERHIEEVRKRDRESHQRIRAGDPAAAKERSRRHHERVEVNRLFEAGKPKPDVCEICNELNIRIVFDHCHARGHFRGWICDRCNRVLGLVKDSVLTLRNLAQYLENDHGKHHRRAAQSTSGR